MRDVVAGALVGLLFVALSACVTRLNVDCVTDATGHTVCTQSSEIENIRGM